MEYVILDLEWNNAKSEKLNKYVCEIFEIGAVKMDCNLNVIGQFDELIRPQILPRFNNRILELTNMNTEELEGARILGEVFSDFEEFVGKDSVVLTWSRSDLPVLIENYKYIDEKLSTIPFMDRYADLQVFVQAVLNQAGNQIGLTKAAELLLVDISDIPPHRAINDCIISARIFQKAFNEKKFTDLIFHADDAFYERLNFRPTYISDISSPSIPKKTFELHCMKCKSKLAIKKDWRFRNQSFFAIARCKKCEDTYACRIKIKETIDGVKVLRKITAFEKLAIPEKSIEKPLVGELYENNGN